MKRLLSLSLLFSSVLLVYCADISIRIQNPPEQGKVVMMAFDSANAFGDFRDPIRTRPFTLGQTNVFTLSGLIEGTYAIVVYYDENGNGVLDENFLGIPAEPIGFSNGYRPKGPPSFVKAGFQLGVEGKTFELDLRRPLGERGQVAVGVGIVGRSSPYRDYNGQVAQIIPAITYIGDRIQILGPNVQVGLLRRESFNLALRASYAIGVYEEADSPFLQGMGNREDTMMAGFALEKDLPGGFELGLSYQHDALDRIGGGQARMGVDKSFQTGIFRFSPQLGINWLSKGLNNHYYGVAANQANAGKGGRTRSAMALVWKWAFVYLSKFPATFG
jgi:outer membrane protein